MDESVKRTTIGGRRLFPIPICEIIETFDTRLVRDFCRERGCNRAFSREWRNLASDRRSQRGVRHALKICAACFADKSLSIGCQAAVKRVAIEISTNVARVTRSQRLIHPLSFSIPLSLHRNGTTE